MTTFNISSFIWGIADDVLRDVYVRGKYRDVILPMTVIRRLDAVLEPTKDAVLRTKAQLDDAGITNQDHALRQASGEAFYNTSTFRLRDLASRGQQQRLRADFEAYLDAFSPNIQEVLEKFKFRHQIPTLVEADALGFLLEKFLDSSINLSPRPVLNGDGSVRLKGLDNHGMGTVFEELIRRFNEENNEEAGEHFTPRDVVKLMASLVFLPVAAKVRSGTYLVYDGACGTGGMLTVAEETLTQLAAERGKEVSVHLYGQEVNPETYAISKADLILKGEGVEADNMRYGSTLSSDAFPAHEFDFMLSNPPYGKSWKSDLERMGGKSGFSDPRFVVEQGGDPDYSLRTRSSDGQLMFLANMLSKMKQGTSLGSRIAEVHNGSSLFTGDAEQGESNIDVLAHYTPVDSYYRLVKTVEGDPEFDIKRAGKKLRRYVEDHDHAIRLKAEIMVDHYHEQVSGLHKIGGQARAMVVTSSVRRAITYFHAIRDYLAERKSPYRAIIAFSGEHGHDGTSVTEASLNGFSSTLIATKIQEEPYRFLICADKFQTGYDEPLLHTMYVDKILSGVRAVQTLSRLNRAHPKKHDAFVLDFSNDTDTIKAAFADYYRTTILSDETDPDRLHDLKAALDGHQVYDLAQVDEFVERYLLEADRDQLDPILDACVEVYREQLEEDGQVDFKGKAKGFVRSYGFLATILPYTNAEWEKLSIFLTFLVPKLPAPVEDDLSKGILEAIDMDSYRVEKRVVRYIQLADEDAEIDPVTPEGGGQAPEMEMDRLSNIIRDFNNRFGNIEWKDHDKIEKVIAEDLPAKVAEDRAYQNAMANSDRQNARIEHDKALERAMTELLSDHTELFKQFSDNESFRRWLSEMIFAATYVDATPGAGATSRPPA